MRFRGMYLIVLPPQTLCDAEPPPLGLGEDAKHAGFVRVEEGFGDVFEEGLGEDDVSVFELVVGVFFGVVDAFDEFFVAELGHDTSKPSTKATARDAKIFAERKAILSEATKGYFHDFHALRAHGGKTWRAPTSLIRTERSRFWPDWSAKRLSDGVNLSTASVLKGRVSLVSVISSQASEGHVRSFTDLTRDTYDSHPTFQQITINVQLSALRAFLMRLVFNSIRDSVKGKKEQQGYFLCTSAPEVPAQVLQMELEAARRAASGAPPLDESNNNNNTVLGSLTGTNKRTPSTSSNSPGAEAYLRSALHLHNKHVGYVFLVDPGCRVRWAGCAFAEEAERDALRACTGVLLARH
ncbi:unnamed protein product [Tilletia controversa]|nr:unnamed protein product [Tilletia controversa]